MRAESRRLFYRSIFGSSHMSSKPNSEVPVQSEAGRRRMDEAAPDEGKGTVPRL